MPSKNRERRLGRIIARRELMERSSGHRVVVSIDTPRPIAEDDWECWFSIEGLDKPIVKRVTGVDSMQALLLTIEGARVELEPGRRLLLLDGHRSGKGNFGNSALRADTF